MSTHTTPVRPVRRVVTQAPVRTDRYGNTTLSTRMGAQEAALTHRVRMTLMDRHPEIVGTRLEAEVTRVVGGILRARVTQAPVMGR